jgi:hypothetical protein
MLPGLITVFTFQTAFMLLIELVFDLSYAGKGNMLCTLLYTDCIISNSFLSIITMIFDSTGIFRKQDADRELALQSIEENKRTKAIFWFSTGK